MLFYYNLGGYKKMKKMKKGCGFVYNLERG